MGERKIIQIEDKVPFKLLLPLSIQHMFAMSVSYTHLDVYKRQILPGIKRKIRSRLHSENVMKRCV